VFYEVNYRCYGIVPALSNPAYHTSKLTSAVITSLMTGGVLSVSEFMACPEQLRNISVTLQIMWHVADTSAVRGCARHWTGLSSAAAKVLCIQI
jgi:hypothetical protein